MQRPQSGSVFLVEQNDSVQTFNSVLHPFILFFIYNNRPFVYLKPPPTERIILVTIAPVRYTGKRPKPAD